MMRRREFIILAGGAAASWPLAARAQRRAMPVIGWVSSASAGPSAPIVATLRQGLCETGFVEGQDVAIENPWPEGHYKLLPELSTHLACRKVDANVSACRPVPVT